MGLSPRVVTEDTVFVWDGGPQRLARGTVLDVAEGSALEQAIGAGRLAPLAATRPAAPADGSTPDTAPAQDQPDTPDTPRVEPRAAKNAGDPAPGPGGDT